MNAAKLQALVRDLQADHDDAGTTMRALIAEIDALIGERVALADTLRTFYQAPLSMSSVQPILDMAVRLNPSLGMQWECTEVAEPDVTPRGRACGDLSPTDYTCSRLKDHDGPHRAYFGDDKRTPLLETWPPARTEKILHAWRLISRRKSMPSGER